MEAPFLTKLNVQSAKMVEFMSIIEGSVVSTHLPKRRRKKDPAEPKKPATWGERSKYELQKWLFGTKK